MTSTYNIIKDYGHKDGQSATSLHFSAGAVMAVLRRKYPVTYSRNNRASKSKIVSRGAELQDKLIIVDDLQSVSVSSSKASHVHNMSAMLHPGMNYTTQILPGDYVFVWMTQSKSDLLDLIKRIKSGDPCNEWMDGLKFFGKVTICRKRTVIDSANGGKRVMFTVGGAAFTELDAPIFYEPYLATGTTGLITSWMQFFGVAINAFITKQASGGVETDLAVPELLKILYGRGLPTNLGITNKRVLADLERYGIKLTGGLDNPNSFIVPQEVGALFGLYNQGSKPNGQFGWSDIMDFVHGVQKYPTSQNDSPAGFVPEIKSYDDHQRMKFTGNKVMGTFVPQPAAFTGAQTVWNVLQQFINSSVNETYTALKPQSSGRVMPTLTLRQLPFSSDLIEDTYTPKDPLDPKLRKRVAEAHKKFDEAGGDTTKKGREIRKKYGHLLNQIAEPPTQISAVTRFSELPRWYIHPILIKGFDVGRSDALRFNYIHVYGQSGLRSDGLVNQLVRDPPIRDELDISRSGLRPYMQTLHCSPTDIKNGGPGAWMRLLADILMGQELTLTGTIDMVGVQAPIAPGDNIEYDGLIAHIESITHQFVAHPNGVTSFLTNLQITRGLTARTADTIKDENLFVGLGDYPELVTDDPAILSNGEGLTEDLAAPSRQILQEIGKA